MSPYLPKIERPPEEELWVLTMRCPYCNVKPRHWCKTPSGKGTGVLHKQRYHAWWNEKARREEDE